MKEEHVLALYTDHDQKREDEANQLYTIRQQRGRRDDAIESQQVHVKVQNAPQCHIGGEGLGPQNEDMVEDFEHL